MSGVNATVPPRHPLLETPSSEETAAAAAMPEDCR